MALSSGPIITPRSQRSPETDPEGAFISLSVEETMHEIDAELFEDIIKPHKYFVIIGIAIDVKTIRTHHHIKIQFPDAGDLIGQETIEVILDMGQ
jgi:hypothetical protein